MSIFSAGKTRRRLNGFRALRRTRAPRAIDLGVNMNRALDATR